MKWPVLLAILLLIPFASAQGHMKLLAVKETPQGYEGNIADLYLDINPGTGRVFLDTFPLTKLDTQMSTRFAKEIACDYSNIDCDNYDFFYTINAESAIIGGPSAGASVALLTIALLEDKKIDEDIAVTGTINSGGLIGPVGGLKGKIDAASGAGIKKVLIPKGGRFAKNDEALEKTVIIIPSDIDVYNITKINETVHNKTEIDLFIYGKEKGVEVIEVSNLDDLLYEFTGIKTKQISKNLTIDEEYKDTMKGLAIDLCNRSAVLSREIKTIDNRTKPIAEEAKNLTEKSKEAFENKKYYSSASYCFGANVKYTESSLLLKNIKRSEIIRKVRSAKELSRDLNKKIEGKEVKTITDLEAKMIVKERLIEAEYYLNQTLSSNKTEEAISSLAYGIERIYSAYSWYSFFDNRGKKFDMNIEILKKSCRDKLSEAEERYQYVGIYLPTKLENTRRELDNAYEDLNKGNYDLCLFKASKAKAEVNIILSVMGLGSEQVEEILNQKIKAVESIIAKEAEKDIFPILGYSYYEYAKDLKESNKYSSLLYSEYALELSNLDIYFKEKRKITIKSENKKLLFILILGILMGFLFGRMKRKTQAEHPKHKRKR